MHIKYFNVVKKKKKKKKKEIEEEEVDNIIIIAIRLFKLRNRQTDKYIKKIINKILKVSFLLSKHR